jgi:hypothetical protein
MSDLSPLSGVERTSSAPCEYFRQPNSDIGLYLTCCSSEASFGPKPWCAPARTPVHLT